MVPRGRIELPTQGIPALVCHDEIMVAQADKDIADMIMYSTNIDRRRYKSIF